PGRTRRSCFDFKTNLCLFPQIKSVSSQRCRRLKLAPRNGEMNSRHVQRRVNKGRKQKRRESEKFESSFHLQSISVIKLWQFTRYFKLRRCAGRAGRKYQVPYIAD